MDAWAAASTYSLSESRTGESVVVESVCDGPGYDRVVELGLVPGTIVDVLRASGTSALVVRLRGTTLAVDKQLSVGVRVCRDERSRRT